MSESFNSAAPAPTPAPAAPVAPAAVGPSPDQVVVEYGGKALTQAEIVKKLQSADEFINTLKSEREEDRRLLAEATKRLEAAATAQDLLKPKPVEAPAAPAAAPAVDIAAEVDKAVTARERKQIEEANWKAAQDAMTKAFGDKADAKAAEVAASVGMSVEDVVRLARQTPKAFQRLFPELSAAPPPAPTFGKGVNTQSLKPAAGQPARSGFWETGSIKDRTAIYRKRLQELGVE